MKRLNITKKELKRLYEKEELSISEIARKLGISRETVVNRLKEYNIKIKKRHYFIKLPKRKLCNLYKKKKLTTVQIAKIYGCSPSTTNKRLRAYGIKIRTSPHYVHIQKKKLEKLYLKEKLSSREIAKKFKCGKSTVLERMKKYGIKARTRHETSRMIYHPLKYKIPPEKLKELYVDKKLSTYQIAKKYGCSPSTILRKLRKYNIQTRNLSESIKLTSGLRSQKIAKAVTKYPKNEFSGNLGEKAYLIGFRLGDLHVTKRKFGQTIIVQCVSSKEEQVDLIRKTFSKYGHVHVKKQAGKFCISCYLNLSFDFLLDGEDKIKEWILKNNEYFISFLAGYIDAEGSFGVYKGHAEFFVGSYQKNIINAIYEKLKKFNVILPQPRIVVNGGYIDKRGVRTHKDLWGLNIRREIQLLKFVKMIKPFLKHAKRLKDASKVEIYLKNKLEGQKWNGV